VARARGHSYLHSLPTRRSSDLLTSLTSLPWRSPPCQQLLEARGVYITCAILSSQRESRCVADGGSRSASPHRRRGLGLARTGERSEEHTSELQSRENLVCRLLL